MTHSLIVCMDTSELTQRTFIQTYKDIVKEQAKAQMRPICNFPCVVEIRGPCGLGFLLEKRTCKIKK